MDDFLDFKNKTILITGASAGIPRYPTLYEAARSPRPGGSRHPRVETSTA